MGYVCKNDNQEWSGGEQTCTGLQFLQYACVSVKLKYISFGLFRRIFSITASTFERMASFIYLLIIFTLSSTRNLSVILALRNKNLHVLVRISYNLLIKMYNTCSIYILKIKPTFKTLSIYNFFYKFHKFRKYLKNRYIILKKLHKIKFPYKCQNQKLAAEFPSNKKEFILR